MEETLSNAGADQQQAPPNVDGVVLSVEPYPVIRPKFIRGNDDEGGEGNK